MILSLMFPFFYGCGEKIEAVEEINEPPVVAEVTLSDARLISGDSADISALVSDADGVAEVSVYFRPTGASYWDSFQLEEGEAENWTGRFENLTDPGVELYIKAIDTLGVYSIYPENGASEPLRLEVNPKALSLPFTESFELDSGEFSLRDLDWWTPSDARSTYKFDLNTSQAHSGMYSVRHPRGGEGVEDLRDWLISPPLDFRVEAGVMVGWWEFGLNVDEMDKHKLWISTTGRLPEEGGFSSVEILDSPFSGEWGRYRYVDVSEYLGEPLVYVAWSWEGSYADEWFIDDVSIVPLAPDFDIELLSAPNPRIPGGEVNFSVLLSNKTIADADSVSVSLRFPEGGIVEDEEEDLTINDLSVNGEEMVIAAFSLHLDEDLDPNRYLPVEIRVETQDDAWEFQENVLIGYPSRAQLEVEVTENATTLIATIGVGDPAAPLWSESFVSTILDAGTHSFTKEVTDQYQWLPALAGEERWFIQLDSSSSIDVTQAYVSYGQTLEAAETPNTIWSGLPETILIPSPPNYYVLSTEPASVSPGDQEIPISINVYNYASASQGMVAVSLVSIDPDLTVHNGENILVDMDSWQSAESHIITGPSISVAETHTNSQPVRMELLVQDDVETISIPITVDVPWPRLGVLSVVVLDDDNGILEPNETADLEITIVNTGALAASGIVTAELSLESSSTAGATVVNNSPNFGFMNVGDTEDEDDFQVTVTSGSLGDALNFLLEMTDNQRSYTDRFQILLGEKPWVKVTPFDDDIGDSLREDSPDILSIEQRVVDGIVELRIETATPIDPARAFFEAWGISGGAGYAYYRWVLQSGVATMQGYIGGVGFQPLGTMTATYEDNYHVILTFDSADMDLALDSFKFGIAAGWCGPPEYFCDHYPNYWGYPYVSFSTGSWFTVSW